MHPLQFYDEPNQTQTKGYVRHIYSRVAYMYF